MNIEYKITFHTDWHCGSGLAAGAAVDALVIKDKEGMPYVPGKTIKGLVREAVDVIAADKKDTDLYKLVFGVEGDIRGESFFTNAIMNQDEHDFIVSADAASYMYRSIASTAIDDNGIAVDNSLRSIQVTVPCTLTGEIQNIPNGMEEPICKALKYIKRLGQWRNRGLGRCTITVTEPSTEQTKKGGEQ